MSAADEKSTTRGAPLWRRFASMVYDSLLLMAVTMAYGALVTGLLLVIQGDTSGGEFQPMTKGVANLVFAGWLLTLAAFYVFFWRRAGQTAGMRAWRLRVVPATDSASTALPTLKQSVLRAPLAIFALLLGGGGYWWRFFDAHGDCLHDRWSNTRVIVTAKRKRKSAGTADEEPTQ